VLQQYFKDRPSDTSREHFILGVGFSNEIALEINTLIGQMRQIPNVRAAILDIYKTWNKLVLPSE
jgi:hypothetical protein